VLGACWPLTKFWISLVMFDLFWDFDRLVEGGAQVEAKIMGSRPLFREVFGIRVYVMGMGCWPMGLPMFRPIL
jgi:hypothetical protein